MCWVSSVCWFYYHQLWTVFMSISQSGESPKSQENVNLNTKPIWRENGSEFSVNTPFPSQFWILLTETLFFSSLPIPVVSVQPFEDPYCHLVSQSDTHRHKALSLISGELNCKLPKLANTIRDYSIRLFIRCFFNPQPLLPPLHFLILMRISFLKAK